MATPSIPVRVDITSAIGGVRNIQELNRELRDLRKRGARPIPDPTRNLQAGMQNTRKIAGELQRSLLQAFGAGAIVQAVRSSIAAFEEAELALGRLNSAVRVAGESFTDASAAAQTLADEGLGSVAEVSASLSNLLASGFNLEDSIRLLRSLGDVGAFGRTQIESLGQAVVTTTRGLRANRAALIDNIGITRSLSDVWAEYAAELGVSVNELTQNQRNQATLNFVLAEGADRTGDLARLQKTLSGQSEQFRRRIKELAAEFGQSLAPSLQGVTTIIETMLPLFRRWIQLWQIVGTVAGAVGKTIGDVITAIINRDFAALRASITANIQAFEAQIRGIVNNPPGVRAPGAPAQADAGVQAQREAAGDAVSAKAEAARAAREKRATSARRAATSKADRERIRAAKLLAREEEQIEEALARVRIEIAKSTGTVTAELRREAIAREFEEVRALLETRGDAAGIALIDSLINVRAAEERFDELEGVLNRNLTQIQQRQAVIQTQQSAGLLTETQARERVLELQRESRTELERMVPLLEEAAQALGPEAQADVARWKTELEQASIVVNDVALRIQGEFGDALTNFFVDIGKGAKSAKDAFLDLARSMLSSIQRILAEKFTQQLLGDCWAAVAVPAARAGCSVGSVSCSASRRAARCTDRARVRVTRSPRACRPASTSCGRRRLARSGRGSWTRSTASGAGCRCPHGSPRAARWPLWLPPAGEAPGACVWSTCSILSWRGTMSSRAAASDRSST